MSLQIVTAACEFAPDRSRGKVVLESDCGGPPFHESFDELNSQEAVQLALNFASQMGCAPAHLNGNKSSPYAVNGEGLSLDAVKDGQGNVLPATDPRMQPVRYRVDVPVSRPMR